MAGVIFLDFDGPIFPVKAFLFPENNGKIGVDACLALNLHPYVTYWKADPAAIAILNKLYEIYPYDLVISSSWADDWLHDKKQIQAVLDKNELKYDLHPEWRTPREYDLRHEQIAHWLQLNPSYEDKYVIIDDVSSGEGLADKKALANCGLKKQNIFLVDIEEGLTYKDYQNIAQILKKW